MKINREEYIKYFTHMQDEDQKCMLVGMAWNDIGWHIHGAVDEDTVFTTNELADMFPKLLGHIREDLRRIKYMLKVSEVVKYIEGLYNIELIDYQKDFLKHIIAGDVIYTPRCFGRSILYDGYAAYLKNVVGKTTDYSVDPLDFDKIFTYKDIPENTLMDKRKMEEWKLENPKKFAKEYECKY